MFECLDHTARPRYYYISHVRCRATNKLDVHGDTNKLDVHMWFFQPHQRQRVQPLQLLSSSSFTAGDQSYVVGIVSPTLVPLVVAERLGLLVITNIDELQNGAIALNSW